MTSFMLTAFSLLIRLTFPGIKDFCLTTRNFLHIACDDDKAVNIGRNGDQAVDHVQFLASLLRLAQQSSPGPGNFRVDLHKALSESQRKIIADP